MKVFRASPFCSTGRGYFESVGSIRGPFLVDGHVHLHRPHDPERLFESAYRNLVSFGGSHGVGVLLLAETPAEDAWQRICEYRYERWQIVHTHEEESILVRDDEGEIRFLVVAGCQVRTEEGLEVLALGTRVRIPDGLDLGRTLELVWAHRALAVLPWSPGKWWFARGRRIAALLGSVRPDRVWLGDIRGRPGPDLGLLFRAERRGFRILRGTDPLPLQGEEGRVGSYGSRVEGEIHPCRPWATLRVRLEALPSSPPAYGTREGPRTFLVRQLRLRLSSRAALPHDTRRPDVHTASVEYARRFRGPVGEWLLTVQRRTLAALPLAPTGAGILELGGGHGQLLDHFLAQGARVVVQGSDLRCRIPILRHLNDARGRVLFVVSSLWKLPFADLSFDYVVAIRLLAHVEREDLATLLDEMARVARRGIVVDFPPRGGANLLEPALFGLKRWIEGNTRPFFTYDEEEIREYFSARGFSRIRIERQFWLPMVLHRALGRPGLSERLEAMGRGLGLVRYWGNPALLLAERPETRS